jgi:hypothetical protein
MTIEEVVTRTFGDLASRVSGPLKFRLVLQPLMATVFAVRAGLRDAKASQPPYFWAILTRPDHRRALLRGGWKDVGKIFIVAVVIDVIYQVIVERWVYPGEAILVAVILALVPYLVIRGPVTQLAERKQRSGTAIRKVGVS